MADIVTMAKDELKVRGKADAAALAARAVSGEADGTELTASQDQIPTWRQRDFSAIPIGSPYKWNGLVYKLWQQHDATQQPDWTPDQAVSLWDVCHTTDPAKAKPYTAPQGSRGMWQEGECCVEQDHVWRCKKDSTVYPPSQLPDSWEDLGSTEDVQEVALDDPALEDMIGEKKAAALREEGERGDFGPCLVEGPISLDLATSAEAARLKGYCSPVAGDADILLVPSIAAGNLLGKALYGLAGGKMAGVVLGASVPIALNSRGASWEEKYNSILICTAMSRR